MTTNGQTLEVTHAYIVPPGYWRIQIAVYPLPMNFCLGAPYFKVEAGDVLYAGSFDLTTDSVGPDMAIPSCDPLLIASPALGPQIKAARWMNGSTEDCGMMAQPHIYALEFKDAPQGRITNYGDRITVTVH